MPSRDAVDTIRGYFYQFNKSIFEILSQTDENTQITIEGIEDIDLKNENTDTFIQCKYYSGQEYNHSVIKKAIILFFFHFIKNKDSDVNYHLYANFDNGQKKLPSSFNVQFVKENFLTYTHKRIKHILYKENPTSDDDIEKFINKLNLNINAPSYEQLEKDVIDKMKKINTLNQNLLDLYLLQAGSIIKKLATSKKISDRTITKKEFIQLLLNVNEKVDKWYVLKIGYKKYYSMMKKKYFTIHNISPYERFFIIDCSTNNNMHILKNIIYTISQKWSKLTSRSNPSFCPYIVFYNLNEELLLKIKEELFNENFYFVDGYCFKNANFNVNALLTTATYHNKIKIKFIEPDKLIEFLDNNPKTKILYQFYSDNLLYVEEKYNCINIEIENTDDIVSII